LARTLQTEPVLAQIVELMQLKAYRVHSCSKTEDSDARHNGVLHAGVVHHGGKGGQDAHTQLLLQRITGGNLVHSINMTTRT